MTSNVSDLVKAIEFIRGEYRKHGETHVTPNNDKPIEIAIVVILNAAVAGTLTPAEQCFSVKRGYEVKAEKKFFARPYRNCHLAEALTIRSVEDVRRETLGGWESIEAAKRVAYRAGYYQAECELPEPEDIPASVDKWKEDIRAEVFAEIKAYETQFDTPSPSTDTTPDVTEDVALEIWKLANTTYHDDPEYIDALRALTAQTGDE